MIPSSSKSHIKRAQKESALFRIISEAMMRITQDNPKMKDFFVTKVTLSSDKSTARVFCHSSHGKDFFEQELFPELVLYKPSIRALLSREFARRYTPDIAFAYDDTFAKIERIEQLLERVTTDEDINDKPHDTEHE